MEVDLVGVDFMGIDLAELSHGRTPTTQCVKLC